MESRKGCLHRLQHALLTVDCTASIMVPLLQARDRPVSAASSQAARAAWTPSATTAQRCATSELAQKLWQSVSWLHEELVCLSFPPLCPAAVVQDVSLFAGTVPQPRAGIARRLCRHCRPARRQTSSSAACNDRRHWRRRRRRGRQHWRQQRCCKERCSWRLHLSWPV